VNPAGISTWDNAGGDIGVMLYAGRDFLVFT
jgi:hypothetical protein